MPNDDSIVLELQRLSADKQNDLADLLRKALIVATKLKIGGFRNWINKELQGYDSDDEVPEYREVRCELRCRNPYHGLIPLVIDDERIASALCDIRLTPPISGLLQALQEDLKGGHLTIPFSHEQQATLMRMQGRAPMEPMRIVSRTQIAHILDIVRTTILEWALQLEQEGILGSGMTFSQQEREKAAASQSIRIESFQGIIGNVSESSVTQNLQMSIRKSDLKSLRKHLEGLGLTSEHLDDLEQAIAKDPVPSEQKGFGPEVSQWMGKVLSKVASGAISLGIGTAGSLIASALWAYYGFGSG